MSIALSVNLNKIALLRNSRDLNFPDVEQFAKTAFDNGAAGITIHPRPDRRHALPEDVIGLTQLIRQHPAKELNIEGNPFSKPKIGYAGFLNIVLEAQPHQCTLVPDAEGQRTSDHGWDLSKHAIHLAPIIQQLQGQHIRVSLFMDADSPHFDIAKQIGADRIEIYTAPYALAYGTEATSTQKAKLLSAAKQAQSLGLELNAGHDLCLKNIQFIRQLVGLKEVSIGHALTVEALQMGFANTVQAYCQALA